MANGKWDLTFLYKGFDDPQLEKDIEKLHALALEGRKLPESEGSDVEKLTAVMQAETELNDLLYQTFGFVQLSLATDCNNQQGQLLLDRLSNLMVDVRLTGSAWVRFIGAVDDLEGAIAQSDYLKSLAFHLREYKEQSAHMLDADLEKWALRLSLDGVPVGIDSERVRRSITETDPRIEDVHHVHIWAISTTQNALTAHVVVRSLDDAEELKHEIKHRLEHEGIGHATLEFELCGEHCAKECPECR